MRGELEREGTYELFETTHGHQILVLNNKVWFAVVKGKYGDILIKSDSDHKKSQTLKSGKFYLANFEDDPEFRDMPHLFLEEGDKYREWILPNDAATEKDYQKKLVKTGNLVSKEKVNYHVKGSGEVGSEKKYKGTKHSVESRGAVKRKEESSRKSSSGKSKSSLEEKSTKELYAAAKVKNISGRSKMNRKELIRSLKKE